MTSSYKSGNNCFQSFTSFLASQFFSPELCCGDVPLRADNTQQRCCGNVSYSSLRSMCCWESAKGHYVLDVPDHISSIEMNRSTNSINAVKGSLSHRFLACCGHQVYDFRFYTCCDGIIRKQSSTGNTGCCGHQTYDPYTELCCDGRILKKTTFDSFCCGARAYDHSTQVCCGTTVHDVGGSESEQLSCCADLTYNTTTQLCCDRNRLQKSSSNSYCCGDGQFDWETQLCCDGTVFNKESSSEFCCGTKPYDTATHLCCQNNVVPRKSLTTVDTPSIATSSIGLLQVTSSRFRLSAFDDEDLLCCGNQTYNFDEETCCQGRVIRHDRTTPQNAKCCGGLTYDENNQICCQGKLSSKKSRAEDCCGPLVFNVETQVCCQGVIHDLRHDSLLYCCGSSTFDPERETCCNGKKTIKQSSFNEA